MTAGSAGIRGDRWFHRNEGGNDLTVITAATGLATVVVVLLFRSNSEAVAAGLVLAAFVALAVVLLQSRTTMLEIDRDKGEVVRATKYLLITSRRRYRLEEFEEVRILTVDEPVEDGYRAIRYALVLSGKSRSLELLSTSTEGEAMTIRNELTSFLGLTDRRAAE